MEDQKSPTFDSATLQSHQALEKACTNAGGNVYLINNVDVTCQVSCINGHSGSFAVDMETSQFASQRLGDEANIKEEHRFGGHELAQVTDDGLASFIYWQHPVHRQRR
jgi:hypothetical protein